MPEVLDALFIILMENTEERHDSQIFKTLVDTVLYITDENSKFSHFLPVLDAYIDERFDQMFAFQKLLDLLWHEVENAIIDSRKVVKIVKCLQYIFKFIVRYDITICEN